MSNRIRIATYNVHRCVGTDGRVDPRRIAEVIQEMDVDAVGLQEVESALDHGGGREQLETIARLTGMEPVPGPTLVRGRRRFGNALLSRMAVTAVTRFDLSVSGREPRGALQAALGAGGQTVRLLVTHLGLRPFERRRQVGRLVEILMGGPEPVALMGDLNEEDRTFFSLSGLHRWFGRTPRVRSFPSRLPLLALDRVFVKPRTALVSVSAHGSRLARLASDHLPVCATLAVGVATTAVPDFARSLPVEGEVLPVRG